MNVDIVIKNAMVLSMDEQLTLREKADLAIKNSKIIEISPQTNYSAPKVIEAGGKLIMPGLINTHTHAGMTMMRGLADDLALDKWWNEFIFPIENKLVDPEFVRIGVSLAAIEMIKSGTTTFSDMYFFEDVAAEVCKKVGIRAMLAEGLLDAPTPNCKTPAESLHYTEKLYAKWRGDSLIRISVGPHAPYSCSPSVLKKANRLAEKLNLPLHIHLSETAGEVKQIKAKYGLSPAEHLEKIGFLSGNVMAAHCVHLSTKEMKILKKRGVKVADCPESNMKLASGCAPIVELMKLGVIVGLGTDGAASNNNLDMFDEMDAVAKLHKVINDDPTVMDAKTVLRMGTLDGAKVLQMPEIGSLEVGKKADIVIIDLNCPQLTPLYDIYSNLVYSAGGSEVETVIINGKLVMEDRKIMTIDEKETMARANHLASKIKMEVKHG